ncbi:MAG: uncharacterized protein A8A55_1693 [Amphiamblys sp. WSBS2006]|nr:MAG: uncharacterized protein A8A55_1693 [Amphiamblys sp. WSBS2006]
MGRKSVLKILDRKAAQMGEGELLCSASWEMEKAVHSVDILQESTDAGMGTVLGLAPEEYMAEFVLSMETRLIEPEELVAQMDRILLIQCYWLFGKRSYADTFGACAYFHREITTRSKSLNVFLRLTKKINALVSELAEDSPVCTNELRASHTESYGVQCAELEAHGNIFAKKRIDFQHCVVGLLSSSREAQRGAAMEKLKAFLSEMEKEKHGDAAEEIYHTELSYLVFPVGYPIQKYELKKEFLYLGWRRALGNIEKGSVCLSSPRGVASLRGETTVWSRCVFSRILLWGITKSMWPERSKEEILVKEMAEIFLHSLPRQQFILPTAIRRFCFRLHTQDAPPRMLEEAIQELYTHYLVAGVILRMYPADILPTVCFFLSRLAEGHETRRACRGYLQKRQWEVHFDWKGRMHVPPTLSLYLEDAVENRIIEEELPNERESSVSDVERRFIRRLGDEPEDGA